MIINIINRVKRTDRREAVTEQMEQEHCSYRFWDGVEGKVPKHNIHKAHKNIIQWAKDMKMTKVCVAEDDACFCAPGAWKYFLDNEPVDADMYVASYYSGSHDEFFNVKGFRGMTLYILYAKAFDLFLSLSENLHIDGALAMSSAKIVTCYPFAAIQSPGYSDQRKRFTADDQLRLKNKILYTG